MAETHDSGTNERATRLWRRLWRSLAVILLAGLLVGTYELQTSHLQAYLFSELARQATFELRPGPSPESHYPTFGPYDERLGYVRMPRFLDALTERGFTLTHQARTSPTFQQLTGYGLFPVYPEKTRAGLVVLDRNQRIIHESRYPERVYGRFEEIPELVVDTLLFIENRELLDTARPYLNPAVEWDRLFRSITDVAVNFFTADEQKVAGGSTLATQIEKYRHSPEGRTASGREKLRQMVSASLRAYRAGPLTLEPRRRIVRDYINSVPLSAAPGFGEVNGLGDGLWAWYGSGFDAVNTLLSREFEAGSALQMARAVAYKQVLSLFLAQRRPSYYLGTDPLPLEALSNIYLQLLEEAGVIDAEIRHLASQVKLRFGSNDFYKPAQQFLERKAANAVRSRVLTLLDMPSLYTLDRLDLTVHSTLDADFQNQVTTTLKNLNAPGYAKNAGLFGFRLLNEKDDLSRIVYSFTLIERGENANLVRIQTDNFDQPFNINEGVKLDLGSTAKLRTMVTYLDIIASLFERHSAVPREALRSLPIDPNDRLSRWVVDYLLEHAQADLTGTLEAALERTYSANPYEQFYTGGGLHTFANFDPLDNDKVMTLRHAFHNSVNLVFIRLMRDIVRYYMFHIPGSTAKLLEDTKDERRPVYLARFADREGSQFIARFYRKYQDKTLPEALELMLGRTTNKPHRVAVILRSIAPQASAGEFAGHMLAQLPDVELSEAELNNLYERYAPERYSLPDRGFIARAHPLELWVVQYLQQHPQATLADTLKASAEQRQDVYQWLYNTRHKNAQDSRIRYLLEVEAFLEIHRQWKRMGFPFDTLVPSYATSIGSSGDRPAALAELMGILVNDGVYLPTVRIEGLHFAKDTPYETVLARTAAPGERVLAPEVARVLRGALAGVVEFGTARRVHNAYLDADGKPLPVGGKTGTGDHRRESYGAGGRVLKSEVVNRTATFVFYLGDRYFGTITAYVPGPEAAKYHFTSGLPAQILKALAPALTPLVARTAPPGHV